MELERYIGVDNEQDGRRAVELIILNLGDIFDIRIVWDADTALMTGACALAGGMLGGYVGGKMGAAVGAGVAGAAGLATSTVISLRQIWSRIKSSLEELYFIVINFLRQFDANDILRAVDIVFSHINNRRLLAISIVEFLAEKLGRHVLSSIEYQ